MHREILFSHEEELNYRVCRGMEAMRDDYYIKHSQSVPERGVLCFLSSWSLDFI